MFSFLNIVLAIYLFLDVQDSSIGDLVTQSDYNDYDDYNRDSILDLDWERFSELVTLWHSW